MHSFFDNRASLWWYRKLLVNLLWRQKCIGMMLSQMISKILDPQDLETHLPGQPGAHWPCSCPTWPRGGGREQLVAHACRPLLDHPEKWTAGQKSCKCLRERKKTSVKLVSMNIRTRSFIALIAPIIWSAQVEKSCFICDRLAILWKILAIAETGKPCFTMRKGRPLFPTLS